MNHLTNYLTGSVSGKNIVITGGSTGIGRATAILLSELGANVLIAGYTENHLKDALEAIRRVSAGAVYGLIADLSTEKGIDKLYKSVDQNFEKLDVIINNVGLPFGEISEGNYKDLERVVNTNLLAYIACTAEALKRMTNGAHIVNIGSMSADLREGSGSIYVATKSGIQSFTESLRKKANEDGIKVTLIEPGAVDTDMQEESVADKKEKVENCEMLEAEDIAFSILYCLSQPKRCAIVGLKVRPLKQLI